VLPGLAAQAGGTMAQFIIVTDAKGTKYRLNVAHIASYAIPIELSTEVPIEFSSLR
jgi:CRISPR/Cas system-associated exonuclease Cas4 (RecB family)